MAQVQDMLTQWGALEHGTKICSPENLGLELTRFTFREALNWCNISGNFAENCSFWINTENFPPGGKISIIAIRPEQAKHHIDIVMLAPAPNLQLFIGGSNCRVFVGAVGHFVMHAMLWGGSQLVLGDAATCNGARAVLQRSGLVMGQDCMLSDEILLQSSHQHTLVDLPTRSVLNRPHETILLGEHVWLGRRSVVMPGVRIGQGAVLAAGAVATRNIMACCAAAGVPAAVIRENTSWCRNDENSFDAAELMAAGILQHPTG